MPRLPRRVGLAAVALVAALCLWGMGEDSHGNSPLAATPVPADGALVAGCIETPGDVDYFLFSAVGGRRLLLQTSHLSPGMDSILYLFGSDGQTILAVDNDSGGGRASRIEWTAPASGTYFVMVRHAQATSGTGCYDLSIGMVQTDDHGDTPATATAIPSDGSPAAGFIETPADVDFFLFVVEASWVYVIETSNLTAGMNTVLALYDRDGQTLIAQDDDSGVEGASRIVLQAPSSGTYFVAVAHTLPVGTGGYEISIRREGYGDDHGGEPASATPLASGSGVVSGRIEVPDDVDAFSFPATGEGEYTFSLSSGSEIDVRLSLYGTDGMTLLWEETLSRTGKTKRSWTAAASGIYFLLVRPGRAGTPGAYAIDLGSVLKLREVGSFGSAGYSVDVRVDQAFAYLIVGVKGLLVVDLSDPSAPREVASHSTRGYARSLDFVGRIAYVADRGGGLVTLDLTTPTSPRELAVVDTAGSAQDVFVQGRYAYVADNRGGLVIVDAGNAASPQGVGQVATAGSTEAVYVGSGIAFVAEGEEGIELIDVRDPRKPTVVAGLDLSGEAHDLWQSGTYLYVACGYGGVKVVDVGSPSSPVLVGEYDTQGEATGLFLSGSTLYVADGSAGLLALSLADPRAPAPAAQLDTPGSATSVFVQGDYAYVADREEGLRIVRLVP